jgi:glycosyltransferase involved in cell wall biosynthesis
MPSVEVHVLTFNEEDIIPWTLAHYAMFADRIIVHDSFSTDATRDICRSFGATVVDWDTQNQINDQLARELKSTCWMGTECDWVIVADADELIYSPRMPMHELLRRYDAGGLAAAKPIGWELCSDTFPQYQPGRQLYDVVQHGARDENYGKPVLFSPRRVWRMNFGAGAHDCEPFYKSGVRPTNFNTPTDPPAWLLHAKHLGPVDRIAKEFERDQSRLSAVNHEMKWGNFAPPADFANERRATILANLQRIIL